MQPPYSPNTVNQTVEYGGQVWHGNPGSGWTSSGQSGGGGGGGGGDVVTNAQKLLDFQRTANAPAISTLQGQVDPLSQRYSDLIASVKGLGAVSQNATTLASANALGQRGLTSDSPLYQQQMAAAQLPVNAQIGNQLATINQSQNSDVNAIQNAIAQLQAGETSSAVSGGLSQLQSANQLAGYQAQANAQIQAAQAQAQGYIQAAQAHPYIALNPGQALGNSVTGNIALPNFVNPLQRQLNG